MYGLWRGELRPVARHAMVPLENVDEVMVWVEAATIPLNKPVEVYVKATHAVTLSLPGSVGMETVPVPAGAYRRSPGCKVARMGGWETRAVPGDQPPLTPG